MKIRCNPKTIPNTSKAVIQDKMLGHHYLVLGQTEAHFMVEDFMGDKLTINKTQAVIVKGTDRTVSSILRDVDLTLSYLRDIIQDHLDEQHIEDIPETLSLLKMAIEVYEDMEIGDDPASEGIRAARKEDLK